MSDDKEPREEREIAAALRLRADPPRVMRLSRRTLTVLGAVGGLALGAILITALQDRKPMDGPPELYSTERIQAAEGLSRLPTDYTRVPQLGPPLPGELGRPILSAQQRGQPVPMVVTAPTVDPDEQRRLQELEAARLSRLFAEAKTTIGNQSQTSAAVAPMLSDSGSLFPPSGAGTAPDATDRREAFLDEPIDRRTTAADRLVDPPSPYVLLAGAVVPAALVTGLRSDLPGQITAQVTSNVYDSPTGRFLLIPQGSRLIGEYDSRVTFGQSRMLLAWTRLILPNGRSVVLERQPGADETGYAGLEDGVDNHWDRLFMAAGLATVLNIGVELGVEDDDDIARAIREGSQDTIERAGDEIVRRQTSNPPTLTIRSGFPVLVIITRDLILEPYRN
ncbi:MAG: conjugal transfer protein TraI [Ponticaulis sp.]|nr:conjugal transfer protein TraI [Ponticaulis sp.]